MKSGKDQAAGLREMMKRKKARKKHDRLREKARGLKKLITVPEVEKPEKLSRIIAVTSGKGGVGKSTISANLSLYFSSRGHETVLLDADLGLANLDVILGLRTQNNLYDVIRGIRDLPEIISPGPMGLKLISGASGISDLANLSESERDNLICQIAGLRYEGELLLIDTGAGLSHNVLSFLALSGVAVVVITEEPASIADSYGIIKALHNDGYKGEIMVVMNRVMNMDSGAALFNKLSQTARRFLGRELKLAGILTEDNAVKTATRKMQPFFISAPNSDPTREIRKIGEIILGRSDYQHEKEDNFLKRLSSFFSGVGLK